VKDCRDIGALYAFSRLRAAEFTKLIEYIEAARDEELGSLKSARAMDDVARSQAGIEVLEKILKYVKDGESLAVKYQQK
jgi:hypothetical protein